MYSCSTCREKTNTIYSSKENTWICEECWMKEDKIYAQKVKSAVTSMGHLKKKDERKYKSLNTINLLDNPKRKHYGVPPPIELE